ncbi:stage II sporulation protein D [Alkalicoccobacillus porphyridii]|uniref:Stage II sporulation protein D n=1 Tax=Alkalicoccobacillus porphyridii TaxID=2597270 RepID=A0A553ZTD8_9BACI|nr:stage II sporulation protein D [Alkalicoccobacillus porphyridii]TSB44739.1 stage II sporulation protein D [Alkalicoccobacillus porphyridii]
MKRIVWVIVLLFVAVLIIPSVMVAFFSDGESTFPVSAEKQPSKEDLAKEDGSDELSDLEVSVYRSQQSVIENVPLEEYVTGVVSSEMSPSFEMEALKAQALAARTYIINQMIHAEKVSLENGALVSDTVTHQVYQDVEELRQKWGQDFDANYKRVQEAVAETSGQVMTYNDAPISVSYFSTSNGFTENSEDYYKNAIPYLRSVESPWDESSPRFTAEKEFSEAEIEQKLGITLPEDGSMETNVERTNGERVASVTVGGETFSGRDIREFLGLDSSDFEWSRQNGRVTVKTKGWGHGVGMSQYGANGMAKEGKTYDAIVQHYYQGIELDAIDHFAEIVTAKIK